MIKAIDLDNLLDERIIVNRENEKWIDGVEKKFS